MSASRSTGGLSHMIDDQSRAPRNIIKIERCSAIISRKAKGEAIAPHYASGEPSASHPMSMWMWMANQYYLKWSFLGAPYKPTI
eukprot:scaffold101315_cov25-Attheya_sp.AAC.2